MKKQVLTTYLAMILSNTVIAESYWLNIPGEYSKQDRQYMPAASYPKDSREECNEALLRYAQNNFIHYIGCDTFPLPDAVNLKNRFGRNAYELGLN